MAPNKKVAIVTGGASGMGLAICKALAERGDWIVNMLDMNAERGDEAAKEIGAIFYQTDVTNYDSLSRAFRESFRTNRRLDFVHANAGIIEKGDFYARNDTGDEPPPAFPSLTVDIDLFSVIQTSYLALHYMRQTGKDVSRSIVVTASCGGLYAVPNAPTYAAAKFGAVGWTRSIAGRLWYEDGIRVNVSIHSSIPCATSIPADNATQAICPGTVRTNLLSDAQWENFPPDYFTPLDKIVDVVMMLIDGDGKEANGASAAEPLWGQAVEVNCDKHYFRKQHEYCDDRMEAVMGATELRWKHDQSAGGGK